jgi:hypothetical protein
LVVRHFDGTWSYCSLSVPSVASVCKVRGGTVILRHCLGRGRTQEVKLRVALAYAKCYPQQ